MMLDAITTTGAPPGVPRPIQNLDVERLGEGGLEDAAYQLEGLFVSMLVQKMRESLSGGDLFGEVAGSSIYGGMFDRMMGEALARRGGLGVAEMVIRSAARGIELQEADESGHGDSGEKS